MILWEPPWFWLVLAENIALFQVFLVTNSYFCHTDFTPAGLNAAGHMLKVIVIEKDTRYH